MVIILSDLFLSARSRCARQGTKYTDNVVSWAWPGIGHHCVYMLLEGVIYFILVILIEVSVLCDTKLIICYMYYVLEVPDDLAISELNSAADKIKGQLEI